MVVRDFPTGSLPLGAVLPLIGLYQTPDLAGYTDYSRPYLATLHEELIAAGQAGAAGVIFAFDVPGKQVRGYYDPHVGTLYRVPAVFVGSAQATRLKALAAQGSSARVTVRAKVARKKTRNLIATLPGKSAEKIVLAANTDGNSWVQENGVIGMLAFARYYAKLPKRCHPRTLELVFSSAHDGFRDDGLNPDHYPLDKEKTAFAFTIEHLGTREILPTGEGAARHLKFTGLADPALFGAGDSEVLRQTAVAATKRRNLPRTAVLKGLGVPNPNQAPPICSMGGLGNAFHPNLVPTLAMISGPWTLYDPAFGRRAIDFGQMRSQVLAAGDAVLALDGLPRAQIAGDYPGVASATGPGDEDRLPDLHLPAARARAGSVNRTLAVRRCVALGLLAAPVSAGAVKQPPQPKSGPGGSDYTHRGVRVSSGGSGADAWYVFEPTRPRPRKAPLAIVMHGYGEYSGYASMRALIRHTVRKGSIAIYPRWQTASWPRAPGRSTSSRA